MIKRIITTTTSPKPSLLSTAAAKRIPLKPIHHPALTTNKMSTTTPSSPLLIRFFDPTTHSPDSHGHTLPLLLSWPDTHLERSHSYIQTLFPLPEASPFNPSAPVITKDVFIAFRTRADLRAQLLLALKRMCEFYGFDAHVTGEDVSVTQGPQFEVKGRRGLLVKFGHNHLRITRILRSLRVLGCDDAARVFHEALVDVGEVTHRGVIGKNSLMFWKRAAERPLWVRPEDEEGRVQEQRGFLWEFERREIGELNGVSGKVDEKEEGDDVEEEGKGG